MCVVDIFRCRRRRFWTTLLVAVCFSGLSPARGQSRAILRLRPAGPSAPIHAIEFSANGRQILAAGDDKFVQVYALADGKFTRNHSASLRQPIGPGPLGSIQAMAMSADQRYVVTGGVGTFDLQAGFSQDGILIPSFGWSEKTLAEVGSVTMFDTRTQQSKSIKTHAGYVLAAEIVSTTDLASAFLITIGNDEDPRQCLSPDRASDSPPDRSLRVFSLPDGNLLQKWPLSQNSIPSKLIVWAIADATDISGLRIAVTSADGKPGGGIDVFQPAAEKPIRFSEPYALGVDRIAATNQLCIASRRSVSIIDADTLKLVKRVDLSKQIADSEFIFSVRSIPTKPALAVVTIRDLNPATTKSGHRLNLVDLKSDRLLLTSSIAIGNRQNPVVAADPTGRFIAATADVSDGLKIMEVATLSNGNPAILQSLKSDFSSVRRASLVPNGQDISLRFSINRDGGDETYDLIDDQLRRVQSPTHTSYDRPVTFVKSPGKNEFVANVTLDGAVLGKVTVDSSMMPLGKLIRSDQLGGRPIVAVAFLPYLGETQARLSLYDPKTGEELRRLNGHEQLITEIEFSRDDRHLTSVSADGMICVWSLSDLAKLVGRRGAILNTRWCVADDGIVIASVEPTAGQSRSGGLQAGDRVIGFINDKRQLVKSTAPEDFFRGLSFARPGTDATVRVVREGRQMDAAVRLGQAADERKPLFSFICSIRPDVKTPDWLAWTPSGPFQSSGAEIESSAGWHFNPKKEGDPVKFAPFAEYRDEFSGSTLVKNLLAAGKLPSVWPPAKTANISLRFMDRKEQKIYMREGVYRSDENLKRMQVMVSGATNRSVSGVVGYIDSNREIQLKQSINDPNLWESEDAALASLNNRHDISVTVHSDRLKEGFQRESFDVIAGQEILPAIGDLPNLRIVSHSGTTVLRKSELAPGNHVKIEAMVDADGMSKDQKFEVLRDNKSLPLKALDIVGNHLSVQVPLLVGKNRLSLRITGKNGAESSAICSFDVTDPILIDSLVGNIVDRNRASLNVKLRSDRELKREYFHLLVDDEMQEELKLSDPKPLTRKNGIAVSEIVISDLLLPEGEHEIELVIADTNDEVWDRRSVKLVALPQPKQPKLEISIGDGQIVDTAETAVALQIECDDLKSLSVHIGDTVVPVVIPQPSSDGMRLTSATIPLARGVNQITVTATSESGLVTSLQRQINRIDRPVGISLQRIVMTDGSSFELVGKPGGSFEPQTPLTSATGIIEGRVRLSSEETPIVVGENVIRASVNGFLQSVVPLKREPDSDEMTFRIQVTLSAATNDIRLDLPGLVESENSVASITAECRKPSLDQTLHLLVISTRVSWRERKSYEKNVLELLGIAHEKMPAFSRVISGSPIYPALTGEVSRSDNVRPLIDQCRFELSDKQGTNNTVLIYFHGEEMRNEVGQLCLMTSDARPEQAFKDPTLITSTYLANQFKDLKCANLLFLDVTPHVSSVATPFAGDPTQPSLGVLRLIQDGTRRQSVTPDLLSHISKILPRVGQLGQLASELEVEVNTAGGLTVTDSIPTPIRWMRFGELASQ